MDVFKKYKEDRVPRELLYVLARVGIFLLADVFAVFAGMLLCSGLSTVINIVLRENNFVVTKLSPALNSSAVTSAAGWLILAGIMIRLFWDDGKRHTAYERFSMPVASASVFFMFAAYAIPSVFIEQAKANVAEGLVAFYKPCMWLSDAVGGKLQTPVAIAAGSIAFICLVIYKLSGDRYLRKHPEL